MVPKKSKDDLEERFNHVDQEFIEPLQTETYLLYRIIDIDKTWTFEYDSETKVQEEKSLASPTPKKSIQQVKNEGPLDHTL